MEGGDRPSVQATEANLFAQTRPAARHGFTLVELLVVISIIALLVGILVPALGRARNATMDMKCMSNLKQIGIAIASYGADNDGRMPDSGSDGSWGDLATRGLLRYFGYTESTVKETRDFIWLCPRHEEFRWDGYWTSSYGYNVQYMLSPGPDYPHSGWNGFGNLGIQSSSIDSPATTLCMVDHTAPSDNTNLWTYVARPGDNSPPDGFGRPDFRHSDRANVLYCDGHVDAEEDDLIDPAKEAQFWDPR